MSDHVSTTNFSASWTHIDKTSDPSFYSMLLDATRAQLIAQIHREPASVFGPLEVRPGLRVLDVGCGTGDYLRLLAPLVAPGAAVGIDVSTTLIDEARHRTASADSTRSGGSNVSFQVADAYVLPFPAASFDRVLATQVLLHLEDAWRAVAEMHRVLAPGGRLSIGEWDWDSTCLAVTDRELGRRFVHGLCDQMRNGLLVREVEWRLAEHGFSDIHVTPQVHLSRTMDATFRWLIEPAARAMVDAGALAAGERTRLLDDLGERAATGRYFLARTYYSIAATR